MRGRMARAWRRRKALLAPGVTLALTGVAAPPAPAVDARPTLEVTPSAQLWERASIHLEAEGFSTEASSSRVAIQVCQDLPEPFEPEWRCMTGTPGGDEPWISQGTSLEIRTDGTVSGDLPMWRYINVDGGDEGIWHDCRRSACTVALVQGFQTPDDVTSDRVPVTFGNEWAPWTTPEAAISARIAPLLRRPMSPSERSDLADALEGGAATLVEQADAAVRDPSVDGTVGEVVRQYLAFFDRHPEPRGLPYWVGRREAGMTLDHMARAFAASAETTGRYDGLDPTAIVAAIYEATLRRAPDPQGGAYWAARLDGGLPLWKVVSHFSRSPEHRQIVTEDVTTAAVWMANEGLGPRASLDWHMGATFWLIRNLGGW